MAVTEEDIVKAFPPGRAWMDQVAGCGPEIIQLERHLRGKTWPEITTDLCNHHSDAYQMLDLEPLSYFLPAFLRAAVVDPKGVAAEHLVYFVCSRKARHLYRRLTDQQRDVLGGVVAWLLLHDDGYFASGEREQFATRLREWNAR